jgi:preprotein translocase subunit SecY
VEWIDEKAARHSALSAKLSRQTQVSSVVAVIGYTASAWLGPGGIGWLCLVIALAASFFTVWMSIVMNEQDQTAELLRCMAALQAGRRLD